MKILRILGGMGLGVLAVALALELLCRCLPVVSGLRVESTGGEQRFSRYLPRLPYTYSFGWALDNARQGRTNAQGFNNSADFQDHAKVLVIGDSFIESLMLDYPQTVQGNLDRMLGGGVFAASASGNGLADSLELARYYVPRIHPANVVLFVEETDVGGLLDAPGRGHSGFVLTPAGPVMEHHPYREAQAKQLALRSALVRYVYYNLKLRDWVQGQWAAPAPVPAAATASAGAGEGGKDGGLGARAVALQYYLDQLHQLGDRAGVRFIFLVDGNRKAMYAGRAGAHLWPGQDRELFIAAARRSGFAVVDTQPVFSQHWAEVHERVDFLPMDGHWNAVAHHLAAQQLLPLLAPPAPAARAASSFVGANAL
ncbi:hypothetical protein H3H37_08650 [Duganella sp. LX20W]|uniref:AlgX/AlgJ SGNH hydrolase-like domain-containing protein n=1 Tax=Rugamonas brunnea TaxID=2758569 RepID=A0A7W2IBA3_9BURK|nr:hypothetical protein [Rugamonas brunnea]MBA5637124.1 hypothetical protein [Rugamonas brunnea]